VIPTFFSLFLSQGFRSLAVSFFSFFSAVYIYLQTNLLEAVFFFFLILYIFKIIGVGLAENLALKFGLKKQMILGHFLTIVTGALFAVSQKMTLFIWLAAVCWGLAIGFFWFGRHGLLAKIGGKGTWGKASGVAGATETLMVLTGPFLGGILINQFGYLGLFLGAIFFTFLGVVALKPAPEEKTHKDVTFKEIFQLLATHKKTALAYFSRGGIETIYSAALILYLFFLVKKEIALGGFFSLSLILVAIVHWLVGKWVDRKGKKELIAFGAVVSFLVWSGRFFIKEVGGFLVFDVLERIAGSMLGIPLEVLSFQKAVDGGSTGRALLFRETAITAGSIFACLALLLLTFLNLPLSFSFVLGSGLSLFPLLIAKDEKTG
jgi:MFS family permease